MVPEDCEVARVVSEEACGLRLDPDDAGALAREIRRLSESPDEVRAMGARSYAAFDRKYRLGTAARAYRRLWSESGGCAGA
jgi:glycosyltransferase involved in cell wall biosynthesis